MLLLTICTPPSSSGSCAIPYYPENKQYVVCKSNIFAIAIFIPSVLRSGNYNQDYALGMKNNRAINFNNIYYIIDFLGYF